MRMNDWDGRERTQEVSFMNFSILTIGWSSLILFSIYLLK